MKHILAPILLALTFSVMFSSCSFAGWMKMGENVSGDTFYVDYERIRKHDGLVYFWVLGDYLKPDGDGTLSSKVYRQGDCKLFRYKGLSYSFHKEPMGGGAGETVNRKNPEWKYPSPNSMLELILKYVCSR